MDAVALAAAVRAGQVSALEVTTEALARAADLNPVVGAFASLAAEHALAQAAAVDAAVADGTLAKAPLAGVPLPIKDLVEVAGLPFEAGSEVMAGHVGVATDVVAQRLVDAGSITLGKTATPEFGFPCYTEPDSLPPAVTPWDTARMAGGSSGGAAAAVASGIVPMAHASDGGGSIRIPASCCGLVGLKPSRGLVDTLPSRVPGPGLATDGVLTTTVRDSALGLDVLAPGHGFLAGLDAAPAGLRIGVTDVPVISDAADVHRACRGAVAEIADVLTDLGHAVVPAPRAFSADRWAAFDAVWATGAASLPLPAEAEEDLTPLTAWLRRRGQAVSAADYAAALAEVQRLTWDVEQAWAGLDLVVTPTLAQPPLPVGALRDDDDPAADFAAQINFTPWTSIANLTGRPSLSLPLVRAEVEGVELPIGVMFTGRLGGDALLLQLAAVLRDVLPWPRTVQPRAGLGAR